MNTKEIRKSNQAYTHEIITKANEDANFKTSLLANPEKVMREFNAKFNLPKGFEVVVEDLGETVFIDFVTAEEFELTGEELELVAGGSWCFWSDNEVEVDIEISDNEVDL